MRSGMNEPTPVRERHDANQRGLVLMVVFALGGSGLLGGALTQGWGYWPGLGGAFLLLVAALALHGYRTGGGGGVVTCPACGREERIKGVKAERYLRCRCGRWSHGVEAMRFVEPDHVASEPVFRVQVPEDASWPSLCPVCLGPATGTTRIEGTSAAGDLAAAIAPVSVQTVIKMDVPCCDQHRDGVSIVLEGDEVFGSFRSMRYWTEFMAANGVEQSSTALIMPPKCAQD